MRGALVRVRPDGRLQGCMVLVSLLHDLLDPAAACCATSGRSAAARRACRSRAAVPLASCKITKSAHILPPSARKYLGTRSPPGLLGFITMFLRGNAKVREYWRKCNYVREILMLRPIPHRNFQWVSRPISLFLVPLFRNGAKFFPRFRRGFGEDSARIFSKCELQKSSSHFD